MKGTKIHDKFYMDLEQTGHGLLSAYKTVDGSVTLLCDAGHKYKTNPKRFVAGYRCPVCSKKCKATAQQEFEKVVIDSKYTQLTPYINNKTKIELLCCKGHIYNVTPRKFRSGYRCPLCSGNCTASAKEKFISAVKEAGYEIVSDMKEYKTNKDKIVIRCNNNHEYSVAPNNFVTKYCRCPHCKGSSGQRELQTVLESYGIADMIFNDRRLLNGLELDIYIPSLKIAIEYQGNYWHGLEMVKERDDRKKQLCEEMGICLIEVWDDDFKFDKDRTINRIVTAINQRRQYDNPCSR